MNTYRFERRYYKCRCIAGNCDCYNKLLCNPNKDDYEASLIMDWQTTIDEVFYITRGRGSFTTTKEEQKQLPKDTNYCKCGCGDVLPKGRSWTQGHNARVHNQAVIQKKEREKIVSRA